jgi:hypothetical protein
MKFCGGSARARQAGSGMRSSHELHSAWHANLKRSPERRCAAIDQSTMRASQDKPLIPESLGRWPAASRPVAAEDLFARSNVLTIF